jgi:hypothetical protein
MDELKPKSKDDGLSTITVPIQSKEHIKLLKKLLEAEFKGKEKGKISILSLTIENKKE